MVDKALFIDSSAAKDSMHELEILSNNLANVSTVGFRSDHEIFKSIAASQDEKDSRVYSAIDRTYSDFQPGPVTQTGRDMDVALAGPGFIAVQSKAGQEGYTRAGDLQSRNGFLTTQSGDFVKGRSGVIKLPENALRIVISENGTVSAAVPGQIPLVNVDQIKLVNPPITQLSKGKDGLFYLPEGASAKVDPNLKLSIKSLEGSNVSAIKTLSDLIELSRRFEFHTNLMKNFTDNSTKANQILAL